MDLDCVSVHKHAKNNLANIQPYYPTALRGVQITPKFQNEYKHHALFVLKRTGWTGFLATCELRKKNGVNKYPRNSPARIGDNNLACCKINLLLDVLLCSIVEIFLSLFVF